MAKDEKDNKNSVEVSPRAFVVMAMHATRHRNDSVHGVLLGSYENNLTKVRDAVAVSHGAPTRPLVETAIGLIESSLKPDDKTKIIGWYTAPMLLEDNRPGPVALRMTAGLASDSMEPALLVIQNIALAECLRGEGKVDTVLQSFGRDFGQQWLEPIKTTVNDTSKACQAAKKAYKSESVALNDLVDHFEDPDLSPWYPNKNLTKQLDKLIQN